MPRNSKVGKKQRSSPARPASGRVRRGRPKVCLFCSQRVTWVDYKDVNLLRRFMSDRGRIKSRGATGNCTQHQRDVSVAIKTAREVALLPYAVRAVASEPGERRGRRGRPAERGPADAAAAADGADAAPSDDSPETEEADETGVEEEVDGAVDAEPGSGSLGDQGP